MKLNQENYYSNSADAQYMSVSQYHNFVGTSSFSSCEDRAMAILKGEYKQEVSDAMLIGSYVDAYFENTLEQFKQNNPSIFTIKGELKAGFKQAEEIIKVAENDQFFMKFMVGNGIAQQIVEGEIGGVKWKGRIDRLHKGIAIVDGKVVKSIRDKVWSDKYKCKLDFITSSGYIDQAAVYQELWYQMSGEKLPFYIAALSKEKIIDKEIIEIPQSDMNDALETIIANMPSIQFIKEEKALPVRCGQCDYCRSTKMLNRVVNLYEL